VQDIIKKIIEIDHMAQKMTDDALALKGEAESSIDKDKKSLREKYMQRAKRRIDVTAKTEEKFLEEALDEIKSKYSGVASVLNQNFNENHKQWAEEIYKRVIGG
jgi:hypothetical protein